MNKAAIEAAIPHRGAMLLVDEILEQQEDGIVCRKTFLENEFFFQGHYPGHPLVPGVILCEAAMQAGAILLSQWMDTADGWPVATRMNDVKFRRMVHPGEVIEMQVRLRERLANAFFLQAKVTCQGQIAVRFEFGCTVAAEPGRKTDL